jgi:hypothetical protein
VVTGVADRVPERIACLVYLNALVPLDGQSAVDLSPEVMAAFEVASKAFDGWRVPTRPGTDRRLSPHPLKTFRDPVTARNPAAMQLPRAYIFGTEHPDNPISAVLKSSAARAKAQGWRYFELPTGHEPERDMPLELADVLLQLV